MGKIVVTNNARMPVNVATSWAGIVQEFGNKIAPGATKTLKGLETGWQDLAVTPWSPDNGFSHGQDWGTALGIGATTAGVLLAPFTGGTSLVLAAGGVATIAAVASTVSSYVLSPAQLRGVPARANDITIRVGGLDPTFSTEDPTTVVDLAGAYFDYSIPGQGFERALSGRVASGQVKGL